MILIKQRFHSSGRETDPEVAVGVQLENPAVAIVDLAIVPNRREERVTVEAKAVLVVLVSPAVPNVPTVKEARVQGHHNDRVAKAGKAEKNSVRNHLIQKESALEVGRIVAKAISDLILRSSGRVVSQRLIFCPIPEMSAQADLSYFW